MSSTRFPTLFVSHGGGPWPWVDGMKQRYAKTAREFAAAYRPRIRRLIELEQETSCDAIDSPVARDRRAERLCLVRHPEEMRWLIGTTIIEREFFRFIE